VAQVAVAQVNENCTDGTPARKPVKQDSKARQDLNSHPRLKHSKSIRDRPHCSGRSLSRTNPTWDRIPQLLFTAPGAVEMRAVEMMSKLSRHHQFLGLVMAALVANVSTVASAQPFKMTTPIAPGVATPDRLETSIGTLNLIDGVPQAGHRREDLRQPGSLKGPAGLSAGHPDRESGRHA
jgi:hypothetical protein